MHSLTYLSMCSYLYYTYFQQLFIQYQRRYIVKYGEQADISTLCPRTGLTNGRHSMGTCPGSSAPDLHVLNYLRSWFLFCNGWVHAFRRFVSVLRVEERDKDDQISWLQSRKTVPPSQVSDSEVHAWVHHAVVWCPEPPWSTPARPCPSCWTYCFEHNSGKYLMILHGGARQ